MSKKMLKALVVEDDPEIRKLIGIFLSNLANVDMAVDGQEGLDKFVAAHKVNNAYDLIILDIFMPNLDGSEMLHQIRKYELESGLALNDRVKVIVLTVIEDNENIVKQFKQNCDGYLTKPFDQEELINVINRLDFSKNNK